MPVEQRGVRHAIDHECREYLARVEQQQITGSLDRVDVQIARPELDQQRFTVSGVAITSAG